MHRISTNSLPSTGFTPTFGPSWVNLYGTPRNYNYEQLIRPRDSLNFGLGEGVAFRGRLLMAVKTSIKQDSTGLVAGVRVGPTPPVSEVSEENVDLRMKSFGTAEVSNLSCFLNAFYRLVRV